MRSSLARSLSCSVVLVASGLASAACGGAGPSPSPNPNANPSNVVQSTLGRDTHPKVAATSASKLVADNTTFAFDLYHAVTAGSSATNLFYSPYSISIALSMAYNGAAGTTATQMASALQFNQPTATLDTAFDELDLALTSLGKGVTAPNGHPFHLNIADSTWGDKTFTFLPAYLDTLAVDYGSDVHVVDFEHDPNAARLAINSWVSDDTNDKIKNLLPASAIDSSTRFVLVNAIYFDAAWGTQFDPKQTKNAKFSRLDGSAVEVPMMNTYFDGTGYAKTASYQAVELPYDGHQTSMVIVVPNEGSFATVESGLSQSFYQTVTSSLGTESVSLGLPKFSIQGATISLKQELSKLGMPDAFSPGANFSAMTTENIWIGDVLHQAMVSVDESGTEAAASTAVIGVGGAVFSHPVDLTIDRPFLFFIRDVSSNTVLFAGKMVDPTL